MSTNDGTVGGMHLSADAKERVRTKMQRADEGDVNRQIAGMSVLRVCGAFLGIVFLAVNSYQATWALMKLSGAATGGGIYGGGQGLTADQWTVGLTAFGLILGAQVIAVRMAMASGGMKVAGFVILIGLMAFSVVTSAMHVAFNVEGGVVESTRSSDEYQMAKRRLESATTANSSANQAISNLTSQFRNYDAASVGEINRRQMPGYQSAARSAAAEVAAAQEAFDKVKESGGGSAMGTVVNTLAGWFGLNSADFAMRFALFAVILMELVRVYLSYLTGRYIMEAMREMSDKGSEDPEAGKAVEKKPEPARAAVMPASGPKSDTIRGPILRDPIEPTKAPRPMFAPRKPERAKVVDAHPARKMPAKDTAPGNKRQASYSQKLSAMKQAIGPGKAFEPGSKIKIEDIKGMVGGNSGTVSALRNDLEAAGLAHWRGKSLIAGAA